MITVKLKVNHGMAELWTHLCGCFVLKDLYLELILGVHLEVLPVRWGHTMLHPVT